VTQRVGRGLALLFHDRGTRRRWVVSSTPRPHFTLEKDPVPFLQEAGWTQGRSERAENLVPTGIRSRTVQLVVSRYTDWATGPTRSIVPPGILTFYSQNSFFFSTISNNIFHKTLNHILSQINWTDDLTSFPSRLGSTKWSLPFTFSNSITSEFIISRNRPALSHRNIIPDFTDSKGNVVLVHDIQTYRRSKGTAPFIHNLRHKWRRVVNFTPRLMYHRARKPVPIK